MTTPTRVSAVTRRLLSGLLPLLLTAPSVYAICTPPDVCAASSPRWVTDLEKAAEVFKDPSAIEAAEDLFRVEIKTPSGTIVSDTHLFPGAELTLIPFHDLDGQADAGGSVLERGDQEVAAHFPPGEIGFAVKHKRSANRALDLGGEDPVTLLLDIKLMDSHLGIVVGVERDGRPGALTLNNPQAYDGGAFGGAHSSMLFLAPEYPSYLSEELRVAFRDNMRTMLVGLNAVSRFPLKFDGGDPLNGHDRRSVIELSATMIKAVTGDEEALDWFQRRENMLYCAELAHVGTSAGLLAPLNEKTFAPLVGHDVWHEFERQVAAHNAGQPSAFTMLNKNSKVQWIELALADPGLEPAPSYAPSSSSDGTDPDRLAFQPMTSSEMIDSFLESYLPRRTRGESVAPAQAALLRGVRRPALGALGVFELEPQDPRRLDAEELYDRLVATTARHYDSYSAYRSALAPLLEELDSLDLASTQDDTAPDDTAPFDTEPHPPAAGLFVPPSLWHLQAQGKWSPGMLGLRYVGHGLHLSLLQRQGAGRQPSDTAPLRITTRAPEASIAGRPGWGLVF